MLFDERVKKYEYKFNDTEDIIIEYIRKHKPQVVKLSIKALANKFFTVPNTILRLSKKMGYDGFSELKNSLKAELSQSDYISYENERQGYSLNIKKTLNLIDYEMLDRIVDHIHKARRIIFYGVGDTISICQIAVKELSLKNPNVTFCLHPHDMIYTLHTVTEHDILFLVSLSGETKSILEIAELAHSKNCQIVSLTHIQENSLEKLATYHLYCYSPTIKVNDFNVTDKTPLLLVLRALTEHYWNRTS